MARPDSDHSEGADDPPPESPRRRPTGPTVVCLRAPGVDAPVRWLTSNFRAAAGLLGLTRGEIALRLVGDAEMAELHGRYKGDPTTTDVLTFDLSQGDDLCVQLMLCVDQARREADRRGHELRHELLLYAIHGLLHCLGHDDADPEAAAEMHAREDDLLTRLGLGAVFARRAPEDQP